VRVILDTNVLIAGLLWRGPPHVLLELARRGTLCLITSSALLTDLAEVIQRPKFNVILARSGASRDRLLQELQQLVEVIEPHPLREPICRDPDDDQVLALAIAGRLI
jgi:putative PIN family toxin of toxin-antitoxin system